MIPIKQGIIMLLSISFVILGAIIMGKANKIVESEANKSDRNAIYRSGTGILVIGVIFSALSAMDLYQTQKGHPSVSGSKRIMSGIATATGVVLVVLSGVVMSKAGKIESSDTKNKDSIRTTGTIALVLGLMITSISGYSLYEDVQHHQKAQRGMDAVDEAMCGWSPSTSPASCGETAARGRSPRHSPPKAAYTYGYTF